MLSETGTYSLFASFDRVIIYLIMFIAVQDTFAQYFYLFTNNYWTFFNISVIIS